MLDASFGAAGIVLTNFNPANPVDTIGRTAATLADGRVLVAGTVNVAGNQDVVLVRYNANGSLDTTFGGGDGSATVDLGSASDAVAQLVLNNNQILIAGSTIVGASTDFAVARLNADGSLDAAFDGDGIATVDFGGSDVAAGLAVQSDGRIVVAGTTTGATADIALARLNTNGSLDTNFDTDGRVMTALGAGADTGAVVALNGSGRIIVAGTSANAAGNTDIVVLRYSATGTLDTTFGGGDGIATLDVGGANDAANALILVGNQILVAGSTGSALAVARFNADGSLDTSFGGGDGVFTLNGAAGSTDVANAIAVDAVGRLIVAGSSIVSANANVLLVRLTSAGTVDAAFAGGAGFVTTAVGSLNDVGAAVVLSTQGDIVVVGSSQRASGIQDILLLRYLANNPPVANNDAVSVQANSGPVAINVLANDTIAPDAGETLTIISFTQPQHGSLALVNGVFQYTPNLNFVGTDTFTYTISDGHGVAAATVTITVTPVLGVPVISAPDRIVTPRQGVLPFSGRNRIVISDASSGDVSVTLSVTRGTLRINGSTRLTSFNGNNSSTIILVGSVNEVNRALQRLQYVPVKHFAGTALLTITAKQVAGAATATDTVSIVYQKNRPPSTRRGKNLVFVGRANRILSLSALRGLLSRVGDLDDDRLTFRLLGRPKVGRLTLFKNGAFRFAPPRNFHGLVTFTVRVSDVFGLSRPIVIRIAVK